jgi:predicted Zn-ribbon and HTH transcriptional regulator/uncharacterized short protein YbdD (DUF466 family)
MAIITITGGKKVNVSDDKAKRIYERWVSKNVERSSVVDLGLANFITLGQIRGIDFQSGVEEDPKEKEKSEKRRQEMRDYDAYVVECRKQTPDEKAMRMVKSFCFLLWKARLNQGEIPDDLSDDIMIRLIPFFAENPNEWHAPATLYQDLIPYSKPKVTSNIEGMKSIAEVMTSPKEKSEIRKASCDTCKNVFEYSGLRRPLLCPACMRQEESKLDK